jgi:alanyl-tRNA synthetase
MGEIEARINAVLLDDLPVTADIMDLDAAKKLGAMALFGEKYGERVRVVSIGEWSRELCVGTHTPRVGQIGVVKLLGESSIGSGVRRVEALVGADAYTHLAREATIVSQLTDTLGVRRDELADRVATIIGRLRDAEKEIAAVRQSQVLGAASGLVASARDIGGVTFVSHDAGVGVTGDDLRKLVTDVRGRLGNDRPALVSMAAVNNDRPVVIVATNERAREAGLKAGAFVKVAAQTLGGGGGGKDDLAQGGGTDAAMVSAALGAVEDQLRQRGA